MHIGLLLFPNLTQLELTGPFEVFANTPGATVHMVRKTRDPVRAIVPRPLHCRAAPSARSHPSYCMTTC
jgi:hypothetical protein